MRVERLKRIPSGRGIAIEVNSVWYINVYAPSGAEKKKERESFFNTELPMLLPDSPAEMLLAGDFNCILNRADSTGTASYSRTLGKMVAGLGMKDAWDITQARYGYTHYAPQSATRLDRIYVTGQLLARKYGIETVATAFTDHLAVVIRLATDMPPSDRGRSFWKMNVSLLADGGFGETIHTQWKMWQGHKKNYPTVVLWWARYVKGQIKRAFTHKGAEQRRERSNTENFYYEAMYAAIRGGVVTAKIHETLKGLKAKILRLYNVPNQRFFLGSEVHDHLAGEQPSLYHVLKQRRRKQRSHIDRIRDGEGIEHTTSREILKVFTDELGKKLEASQADRVAIQTSLGEVGGRIPPEENASLKLPITTEELRLAVMGGKRNKAPGLDGIPNDFLQSAWQYIHSDLLEVVNNMYLDGVILPSQTRGVVGYVPKTPAPVTSSEYRALTLLNSDVKLLARVMVNRIKPLLHDILHPGQHCGVRENTILGAVAAIRDTVAEAEMTNAPICLLSLDFQDAFDRVDHGYMFTVLEHYGFEPWMIDRIRLLYDTASSSAQINGLLSRAIPIGRSLRQGCPLSMLLYALCLDPFIRRLEAAIARCRPASQRNRATIIAYADDVTVILRSPREVQVVADVVREYELASGAALNTRKSMAMGVGTWDATTPMMGIEYQDEMRILGVRFAATIQATALASWAPIMRSIRAQAQEAYHRELPLYQRCQYVNAFLLAKVWYAAQILPPPRDVVRQINTAISWFLWSGSIFRVPLSTLCRLKSKGGMGLLHTEAKCRALMLYRLRELGRQGETPTGRWLRRWGLHRPSNNPPNSTKGLAKFEYLRHLQMDSAYVPPRGETESDKGHRRRAYATLVTILSVSSGEKAMRIEIRWPATAWNKVWDNLWAAPVSDAAKNEWYRVIHEIIPTGERMRAINLAQNDVCTVCGAPDTLSHRVTECGEGADQWIWTRGKMALFLRVDPRRIPEEWLYRPQFRLWPKQKHMATLWMLASFITFRMCRTQKMSMQDYIDFLRRSRWKLNQHRNRQTLVANYLSVLDT